jgi:hypothetical protein
VTSERQRQFRPGCVTSDYLKTIERQTVQRLGVQRWDAPVHHQRFVSREPGWSTVGRAECAVSDSTV